VADRITLTLEPRTTTGKKVKLLRQAGIIPVHLYGSGISSRTLQCQRPTLIRVLARAGANTPVTITVEGDTDDHLAFVREVQWDPIRGDLVHVDFLRTEATQRVSAEVPVTFIGDSPGARLANGSVVQQLRSIVVEALPLDMPRELVVDLALLTEPDSIVRAGDLPLPEGTTLITNADGVVARIEVARVEEEVFGAEAPAAVEGDAQDAEEGGVGG
jgi:large subunit ribosomal protein L25